MKSNELKAEITRCGLKIGEFADLLNISRSALYRKMKGETEFKLIEIQQAKELLHLSTAQTMAIFFDYEVAEKTLSVKPPEDFATKKEE